MTGPLPDNSSPTNPGTAENELAEDLSPPLPAAEQQAAGQGPRPRVVDGRAP
jgi:hypothetical protein